jgi:CDP-glycerol glycerophosphotransferase (TagB/SpsB family)
MSSGYTYTRPAGDIVAAIDQWSVDLLVNHFGLDPSSVLKTGTPRFDEIAARLRDARRASLAELGLSFSAPGRPLVCFATQPGATDKGLRIVSLMGQARPASSPFNAVIKLHPRETDEVLLAYAKAIEDGGFPSEFRVVRDLDMQALLSASDVVITIFSNVGVEAALMNKKLLIANLGREALPLPLDEFEIGLNAYDDGEFVKLLCDLVDERGEYALLQKRRARYLSDNAHLLEGRSAERIWSIIRENLAAGAPPARETTRQEDPAT